MSNLANLCKLIVQSREVETHQDRLFVQMPCNYSNLFQDDVAVIDEIQMVRDPQRGWAWTRALLGETSH